MQLASVPKLLTCSDRNTFAACLSMGPERIREDALRILAPFRLRRRGVETKLVLGNPTKSVDRTLLRNIANALSWLDRIKAGKTYEQIAIEHAIPTDRVRKAIRYAFLAPDIVRAILEGRQPVGLTSSYLLHHPLPDDWEKQRVLVKNAVSLQRPLRGWARLAASCSPTLASTNQPQPGPNSLSWFPDSDSSLY